MQHKKIDLTKHLPQHPFVKGFVMAIAVIGLLGLGSSLTHADLQIQSAINNVISTFKELRITSDGSSQGDVKVILNTGGIWVDTGALGGVTDGALKVNPQGYVYRGLISGQDIASNTITGLQIKDGSITTGHLSFSLSGASGSGGTSTFSCGAGEAVIGVSNGVAQCAPIIGTGDCTNSGGVMGWSSTGMILCSSSSSGGLYGGGTGIGSYRHLVSGGNDIYYGDIDDYFGNVAVGLNSPLAKLHVKGTFRVDTSGAVTAFSTGGFGGSTYTIDTNLKGFFGNWCTSGIDCYMSSAFNPYMANSQIKAVEVVGNNMAYIYDEDPNMTLYHWLYNGTLYPRCTCDTTTTNIECSTTHVSYHSDPYCVDISTQDLTYPGPGPGGQGFPYTPLPIQFYAYNSAYNGGLVTIPNTNAGLLAAAARVGINTLSPTTSLDVLGGVRFRSYMGAGTRNLGIDGNGNVVIMPTTPAAVNPWQTGTSGMIYYNGGNVGINMTTPRTTLHVGGDILATTYFMISDETLKENIVPIGDALSKILNLTGYRFRWKSTERADIGVLAQEVEAQFPELVNDVDGFKSVAYANLVAAVIEAMKELDQRATSIEAQYGSNEDVLQLISDYQANAAVLADLTDRVTALENAE